MRLSSLCVAAVLLLSVVTFAQHSSGGGGSGSSSSGSSGGSSGGGGGSHGGSSGGSSSSASSGGGHSSGGSSSSSSTHSSGSSSSSSSAHTSGGVASHVSSVHSPGASPTSSRSSVSDSHTNRVQNNHEQNNHLQNDHLQNNVRSIREPNSGTQGKTPISEKRSFFSFLRHPFRRPEPNPPPKTQPVADLRRPVCFRGACAVCPPGQAHTGACGGAFYVRHQHTHCTSGEIWSGGSCLLQTQFLDSCNSLRMAMQRQQQRMRVAESQQQNACAAGSTQSCLDSTSAAQSEAGFYRTLQERYQRCMQRSVSYPFAGLVGFGYGGYSAGRLFEPFDLQFNYP